MILWGWVGELYLVREELNKIVYLLFNKRV